MVYPIFPLCLCLSLSLSLSLSLPSQGALVSTEPILRCAAGEALGRMSQVGGDTNFVAQIAQTSFESLKSTRDPVTRTGHSLVLGCLHRYVGGMGSGQHLQMSVSLLHQLSEEVTSPTVQVCVCGSPLVSFVFIMCSVVVHVCVYMYMYSCPPVCTCIMYVYLQKFYLT